MDYRPLRIRHHDTAWTRAFCSFVATIFRGVDFVPWLEAGGWTADYEVFATLAGDEIVATVGRTRMTFVIDGRDVVGYQVGAVATAPAHRARGLARKLMTWVLSELDRDDQPVMLFANANVLGFYPRFGFRRALLQRFGARLDITPASTRAPTLDVHNAADRAHLAHACARAVPTSAQFSARNYYTTLLWHLLHAPRSIFRLEDRDAVLIARESERVLRIDDVLASELFDLRSSLPSLIWNPVADVRFGFEATRWLGGVTTIGEDPEPLFVRGVRDWSGDVVAFPTLAHT